MILWSVLTVMIAIAAVLVASPFIRRLERRRMVESRVVAVYRDQLKEVDNEAAQGVIDPEQADSARMEIKRRLLTADEPENDGAPPLSNGERIFAAIGVASVIVLGSVGLFALTANFEPITTAISARLETPPASPSEKPTNRTAEASVRPAAPSVAGPASSKQSQTPLPPVEEMIRRLVTRLQRNPKDVDGWRMLGWSYFSTERFAEAAEAYGKAVELKPDLVDYRVGRIDSLIRAANGVVTPEAKSATDETLRLYPKDPRSRYFKGLAIEQSGDKPAALNEWRALLADLDPAEPWTQELKQRIAEVGKDDVRANAPSVDGKIARESVDPAPSGNLTQPKLAETTIPKGPTPDDIRKAEGASPSDREAMIHRMVDGLAGRLEQSPRDADGWIKLIRSYTVLGEVEKAKQAFGKALDIFADESAERKRIAATAEELGLNR